MSVGQPSRGANGERGSVDTTADPRSRTDPYAPLPIIGHLHHFLGQPKYKYMQWYLRRAEHEGEGRTFEVFLPGLGRCVFVTDPQ